MVLLLAIHPVISSNENVDNILACTETVENSGKLHVVYKHKILVF